MNHYLSLTAGFAALFAVSAQADFNSDAIAGLQAALKTRDQSITDVTGNNSRAAGQWALNAVVMEGIRALATSGEQQMAEKYEKEWQTQFSDFLVREEQSDILGDHKPLLKFLSGFYDKLEDRLGTNFIRQGLLGDIYLMNFAIPVVFAPKAEWWRNTETANRMWVEYRKHFIPFANVITYWGVKIACNKIMQQKEAGKQGQKLCEKAATKLRWAMGRYVAPKISDFIFNKANGAEAKLEITQSDLHYLNAETLFAEIQNEGAL